MGTYDSSTYGGGNAYSDQRESARSRLLGLLDQQRQAEEALTAKRKQQAGEANMDAASEWMGRGLKGAAMGSPFGPMGAAIGGGIGALSGILGGTLAHHKAGEGWLSSIGDTLTENPLHGLDSALGSPLVGAGIANLAGGANGGSSRNASVTDYLRQPTGAKGSSGLSGPSYGAGPKFGADQPFKFSSDAPMGPPAPSPTSDMMPDEFKFKNYG